MSMYRIRLPGSNAKNNRQEALASVIARAAHRAGITPFQMAAYMSYFLEEVGITVAEGKPIVIPGFGRFYAGPTRELRKSSKFAEHANKKIRRMAARFQPAMGLALLVKDHCPISAYSKVQTHDFLENHNPAHSRRSNALVVQRKRHGAACARLPETMRSVRTIVEKQSRLLGMTL